MPEKRAITDDPQLATEPRSSPSKRPREASPSGEPQNDRSPKQQKRNAKSHKSKANRPFANTSYGQTSAIPGLDNLGEEEEDELGEEDLCTRQALTYLRMVR
jgi:hypothetical protein